MIGESEFYEFNGGAWDTSSSQPHVNRMIYCYLRNMSVQVTHEREVSVHRLHAINGSPCDNFDHVFKMTSDLVNFQVPCYILAICQPEVSSIFSQGYWALCQCDWSLSVDSLGGLHNYCASLQINGRIFWTSIDHVAKRSVLKRDRSPRILSGLAGEGKNCKSNLQQMFPKVWLLYLLKWTSQENHRLGIFKLNENLELIKYNSVSNGESEALAF